MLDHQLSFDSLTQAPREIDGRRLSIAERFDVFHAANPAVYQWLVKHARDLTRQGHKKIGIKMLFEVLRWRSMIRTTTAAGEEFKLNNDYSAHYARRIMERERDLAGVFHIREQNAKH